MKKLPQAKPNSNIVSFLSSSTKTLELSPVAIVYFSFIYIGFVFCLHIYKKFLSFIPFQLVFSLFILAISVIFGSYIRNRNINIKR